MPKNPWSHLLQRPLTLYSPLWLAKDPWIIDSKACSSCAIQDPFYLEMLKTKTWGFLDAQQGLTTFLRCSTVESRPGKETEKGKRQKSPRKWQGERHPPEQRVCLREILTSVRGAGQKALIPTTVTQWHLYAIKRQTATYTKVFVTGWCVCVYFIYIQSLSPGGTSSSLYYSHLHPHNNPVR